MAGYSGTPLPRKLGIQAGQRVALVGAPADFAATLGPLPPDVTLQGSLRGSTPLDVIVLFCRRAAQLELRLPQAVPRLASAGGLWIAWPKQSSGVATDLSDGVVRTRGLATGLVDNKVCAIDAVWSGLRFVVRLRDRPPAPRAPRRPRRSR